MIRIAVNPEQDLHSISAREAADRLRYLSQVRSRARRAYLIPPLALIVFGALIAARGVTVRYWPHAAALTVAWLAVMFVLRPIYGRWRRHRLRAHGGGVQRRDLRLLCIASALIAALVSFAVGVNPLFIAVATAMSVSTYLAGQRSIALACAFTGVIADMLVLEGAPTWVALIIFGIGIAAIGAVRHGRQQDVP